MVRATVVARNRGIGQLIFGIHSEKIILASGFEAPTTEIHSKVISAMHPMHSVGNAGFLKVLAFFAEVYGEGPGKY